MGWKQAPSLGGWLHLQLLRLDMGGQHVVAMLVAYTARLHICFSTQEVTQSDFPLPTLGAKLTAVREEVRTGRGFQLIRCVPGPQGALSLMCIWCH
jgi:hypothetical protein